jgi:hypothetical protein
VFDTLAESASSDLDHYLKQACHSCLRASVNHTHILEMGKGSELHRCGAGRGGVGWGGGRGSGGDKEPIYRACCVCPRRHVGFVLRSPWGSRRRAP